MLGGGRSSVTPDSLAGVVLESVACRRLGCRGVQVSWAAEGYREAAGRMHGQGRWRSGRLQA